MKVSIPTPAISVVIPCYNGARVIRTTVESVLAQTLSPLEVIVVDDGSTDDSAAIAEALGPPVRVIRQPNQGESVARNRGIDEAKGEWVAFLDADDLWKPEKLAEQAQQMKPGVIALCAGNESFHCDRPETATIIHTPKAGFFRREWILIHGAPCHISTLVVRADLPLRFPTWTSYAEDLYYYLDLVGLGPVAITEKSLLIYRMHGAGQTMKPEMGERRNKTLRQWLDTNEDRLDETERRACMRAWKRREKHVMIQRALDHRRDKQLGSALSLYGRVLTQSMVSPTSLSIVGTSIRSSLGAIAERVLHLKKPPTGPQTPASG
jgi:glycosyltransferase involved in cell wall biosynthesis